MVAHVRAARRAGASWEQLQAAVALAAAVNALGPADVGGAVLGTVASEETLNSGAWKGLRSGPGRAPAVECHPVWSVEGSWSR